MNLNQITIPSLNMEKYILFYQELGLKFIVKSLPHYARFKCQAGNSTFSLYQVDQLPMGNGIIIYFKCDNLDHYVNELLGKGFEFEELPNYKNWLWHEAHTKDLDENHLILYYAGENRLNSP
ncbi:VOC family protein [Salmonirosea aquatica]|uniref:VOC family protein n=1 Tax=Salmonirosea aquatica TaxID=2654236 RepID=A0A7C9FZP4_9BACT|nr:VOC family protein [Cytophagaceae bacterium SJW1-29]